MWELRVVQCPGCYTWTVGKPQMAASCARRKYSGNPPEEALLADGLTAAKTCARSESCSCGPPQRSDGNTHTVMAQPRLLGSWPHCSNLPCHSEHVSHSRVCSTKTQPSAPLDHSKLLTAARCHGWGAHPEVLARKEVSPSSRGPGAAGTLAGGCPLSIPKDHLCCLPPRQHVVLGAQRAQFRRRRHRPCSGAHQAGDRARRLAWGDLVRCEAIRKRVYTVCGSMCGKHQPHQCARPASPIAGHGGRTSDPAHLRSGVRSLIPV